MSKRPIKMKLRTKRKLVSSRLLRINAMRQRILLMILLFLFIGCATGPQKWYKPGAGQVDFNLDEIECSNTAKEIARQATLTGKKMDPLVYNDTFTNCIYAKGWSHTPPGGKIRMEKNTHPPAQLINNRLQVGERFFSLPTEMKLLRTRTVEIPSVQTQTFFFQGPGPVYLNCVVQQSDSSRKFKERDYPLQDPLVVFDHGIYKADGATMNWTIFAGKFQSDAWVCGLGAYLILDKFHRITLVFTRDLMPPENVPPPGLTLTKAQKNQVLEFQNTQVRRLLSGFGMAPDMN